MNSTIESENCGKKNVSIQTDLPNQSELKETCQDSSNQSESKDESNIQEQIESTNTNKPSLEAVKIDKAFFDKVSQVIKNYNASETFEQSFKIIEEFFENKENAIYKKSIEELATCILNSDIGKSNLDAKMPAKASKFTLEEIEKWDLKHDLRKLQNFSSKKERGVNWIVEPPPRQNFHCFSFLADPRATPSPDGLFGYMLNRGNFDTYDEAVQRQNFVIQNENNLASIFIVKADRPYPIGLKMEALPQNQTVVGSEKHFKRLEQEWTKFQVSQLEKEKAKEEIDARDSNEFFQQVMDEEASDMYQYCVLRQRIVANCNQFQILKERMASVAFLIKNDYKKLLETDKKNPEFEQKFEEYMAQRYKPYGIEKGISPEKDDQYNHRFDPLKNLHSTYAKYFQE